ncbi:CHC2 zinc finger domain-containing protein [Ideonella sp. B508-1]|uniref:CHC2 zinc finger domain-containing protein n=1 Tax=Ideonella sp. B508-1 TaxID=137716 RepID=UPI000475885D|nr:CHC2 zinc finger domain-containing protein [Ideonella sp. B508-1]
MRRFIHERLPDPQAFFEAEGLSLKGPGGWKTTRCNFHGGSDSMRVNTETGAFKCMNCGVHGSDVLAYHMQAHAADFMEAAEALGATVEDGTRAAPARRTTLSASAALTLLQSEAWLIACTALATAEAVPDADDRLRLIEAARTIQNIMLEVNS